MCSRLTHLLLPLPLACASFGREEDICAWNTRPRAMKSRSGQVIGFSPDPGRLERAWMTPAECAATKSRLLEVFATLWCCRLVFEKRASQCFGGFGARPVPGNGEAELNGRRRMRQVDLDDAGG